MLMPRKVKYRRHHRGRKHGNAARGNEVSFGTFGLKALEAGWITSRQIEATRVAIVRKVRKTGRMWIRIFPQNQLLSSLLKLVWVRVRVHLSIGLPLLSLVV
jgi:ribosomal protein L16, bacterial/organelle